MTGDYSMASAGSVPTELAKVRVVQSEGWLRRIHVAPTHLDIYVAGDATVGARIEVTGADLHIEKRVGTTGKVRVRLPRGLPTDAWVYLIRDNRWLDYRAFPYRAPGQLDGVEIEVPDDPESQVEALLAQGEGPRIEYKRTLPGKDVDSKRKVFKTVAAFANGSGGSIVFGMESDELTLVGLEDVDVPAARDRLGNLIQGIVVPPNPVHSVRSATIDGKLVIVLDVERGPGRPFGLQFQNQPIQFFVRRAASTYPATQEEVRDLAIFDGRPEAQREAGPGHSLGSSE